MGWKGAVRSVNASLRRMERESRRRQRELERRLREQDRLDELAEAQLRVEAFEAHLEVLTSVHKDCGPPIDWSARAGAAPPHKPQLETYESDDLRRRLEEYKPGFFARKLGREAKGRERLQRKMEKARAEEEQVYEAAMRAYERAHGEWAEQVELAKAMVGGDIEAWKEVIREWTGLEEIQGLGSMVRLTVSSDPLGVDALVVVNTDEVVPKQSVSLLKSGRASVKNMPKGRYYELYQDYVCGCVLRVARELFALLPTERVVASAAADMLNTATGHIEEQPILSVAIPSATMGRLNFAALDPSDALVNFVHNMDFKKTKGFKAVERLSLSSMKGA